MDNIDGELGWDDLGAQHHALNADNLDCEASGTCALRRAGVGVDPSSAGSHTDAVADILLKHFKSEFASASFSHAPQLLNLARRYFNVTHGYVLRKLLWVLVPTTTAKVKAFEGEIGVEKDWTTRTYGGLEIDIEEPDLYIPTMSFITYVLLCGILRGLQDRFGPETLPAVISFSVMVCALEVVVAKVALSLGGVENALVIDLACLLGYKYVNLSALLGMGLVLGLGNKPQSIFFLLFTLALICSSAVALLQSLRKLARMQVVLEPQIELHKIIVKGLAAFQVFVWWFLLPSWSAESAIVAPVVLNTAAAVINNVTNSSI